jgi:hypothetical protein
VLYLLIIDYILFIKEIQTDFDFDYIKMEVRKYFVDLLYPISISLLIKFVFFFLIFLDGIQVIRISVVLHFVLCLKFKESISRRN